MQGLLLDDDDMLVDDALDDDDVLADDELHFPPTVPGLFCLTKHRASVALSPLNATTAYECKHGAKSGAVWHIVVMAPSAKYVMLFIGTLWYA